MANATGKEKYQSDANRIASEKGIPPALFSALIEIESGWNPFAIGSKGELGLTQLMAGTAAELGVSALNPIENLEGGATYLAKQFEKHKDWRKALAAYNAGPTNPDSPAGLDYADKVLQAAGMAQADPRERYGNFWLDWLKGYLTGETVPKDELVGPSVEDWKTKYLASTGLYVTLSIVAIAFVVIGIYSLVKPASEAK